MRQKDKMKKLALSLSMFLILMWMVLGTGTSLAWFTDTSEEVNNIFHFADFDLLVEYRDADGNYHDLEGATKVFDDEALYEPGYVQVIYLRVTNNGEVPFKFKTAVNVVDYTEATNVFGKKFLLQDYLRFGLAVAEEEAEMDAMVATREQAEALANTPLSNYETKYAVLDEKDSVYMAVIVRMPKDVDNVANYRNDVIPRVLLGLIVNASQTDAPD